MLGKTGGLLNDCIMDLEILSSFPNSSRQATASSSLSHEKLRAGLDIETQTRLYVAVKPSLMSGSLEWKACILE